MKIAIDIQEPERILNTSLFVAYCYNRDLGLTENQLINIDFPVGENFEILYKNQSKNN